MIKNATLTVLLAVAFTTTYSQVVLNEIYTSPGGGKHEFFELYNSGTETTPLSVDGFSIVTYFEQGSSKGFYVLDLPAQFISPRGYYVGSSATPFNYQGTTNSTSSNFSWNSATLAASSGYLKKWVLEGTDASDGNASYNEAAITPGFNDLFYDRNNGGANNSIFVFKNGIMINSFYGGTGGSTTQPSFITSMPSLNVTNVISLASVPFTINFSSFTANMSEFVTSSTGTDNGFTRLGDGVCNTWVKSTSTVNHTPGTGNGSVIGGTGNVTITGAITRGVLPATTSTVIFDITAGASTAFPVEMQVYADNGSVAGDLDVLDTYITSVVQNSLADGMISISFSPRTANIIVIAKTAAGCFGQVKLLTDGSNSTLPVKLLSFGGNIRNEKVELKWAVDLNETVGNFEVERSINESKFISIGRVSGTNLSGKENYSFIDGSTTAQRLAYRLRMTDKDQKVEYSRIISFNSTGASEKAISLMQNPVVEQLNIGFTTTESESVNVAIIDMTGAVRTTQRLNVHPGNNILYCPLPQTLTSGYYVVAVSHNGGRFNTKFMKR